MSSMLLMLAMSAMGLSYKEPVGLLLWTSLIIVPLLGFLMRRRLLQSAVREREQVLTRHEEVLAVAAEYSSTRRDWEERE